MHRFCTSDNTFKFLTSILSPTQNRNGFSVPKSQTFSSEIADFDIQDDVTTVFFDVVSLFTAIPVDKACSYIRKVLEDDSSLHYKTNLAIDDMNSFLNFVLSNNYFIYEDKSAKKNQGCTMGSPMYGVNRGNRDRFDSCSAKSLTALRRQQLLCHQKGCCYLLSRFFELYRSTYFFYL